MKPLPRVVVIGGGFGGLQCAKALRDEAVEVVLVDPRNYHLFTPLLYQVASCLVNPAEIAAPLRKVFRGARNIRYEMGTVTHIDFDGKTVHLDDGSLLPYDYVVVSTGSSTNYYGNDAVKRHALGLKDLGEALQLRNHVLECLERAAACTDDDERRTLLTFCIVGGGPTGVEYAGALAELVRLVLPSEYPEIPPSHVTIVLLEGTDRLLSMFVPRLSSYARAELARLGVEVRTNVFVESASDKGVLLHDGTEISSATLVWTAGVIPNDIVDAQPMRIEVDGQLRIVGKNHAFAIGDVAAVRDGRGNVLPMISPAAMQAGRYVARHIVNGGARRPFHYRDKGTLATIGRSSAVGQIGRLRFHGLLGWVVWLFVHLYYLIGFENRLQVLLRWSWYYVRLDRPARAIIWAHPTRSPAE